MKLTLLKQIAFLFLLFISPFFGYSQLSEKIHFQTDKDIYLPGETVWFKCFVFFANKPSTASTNIVIGIYGNDGLLIQKKKFPLIDGTCAGEFVLPDSINSSYLRLMAKTINSINPFQKTVAIYRPGKAIEIPYQEGSNEMSVNILSENTTVAPSINNHFLLYAQRNGKGEEIVAGIYNQQHLFVDSVFTNQYGYANFQLTPKPGEHYYAEWKNDKGISHKTELPQVGSQYISLHSEQSKNLLYYNIQIANNWVDNETLTVQLINGMDTLYKASIQTKSQKQITGSIPLDSLQKGLAYLQLLNNSNQLLQQKPVLLQSPKFLPVIRHTGKSFSPKGKNIVEISSTDLAVYDLSLSITDIQFSSNEYNHSIYDDLWSAKANGFELYNALSLNESKYIQNVISAFSNLRIIAPAKQIQDNYLQWNIEQKDHSPLPNAAIASIILADKQGKKQFLSLAPENEYIFSLQNVLLFDSAKLYYSILNSKPTTEKLKISSTGVQIDIPEKIAALPTKLVDQNFSSNNNSVKLPYSLPNENYIKKPTLFNDVQTMQAVVVNSKKVNPVTKRLIELEDRYTSGLSKGMARGYQLNVIDDPNAEMAVDLFSFLSTRLGMFIRGQLGSRALEFMRGATSGDAAIPVLFVDDTESSWDILERYQAKDLAYVKAIPGIVITPTGTSTSGVLYVYTRKGKDIKGNENVGMVAVKVKGYDSSKEFTLPNYNDDNSIKQTDYRSTLYWNPFINTEGGNTVKIEYFNNDISTRHLLVLKGCDADGFPFEIRQILE